MDLKKQYSNDEALKIANSIKRDYVVELAQTQCKFLNLFCSFISDEQKEFKTSDLFELKNETKKIVNAHFESLFKYQYFFMNNKIQIENVHKLREGFQKIKHPLDEIDRDVIPLEGMTITSRTVFNLKQHNKFVLFDSTSFSKYMSQLNLINDDYHDFYFKQNEQIGETYFPPFTVCETWIEADKYSYLILYEFFYEFLYKGCETRNISRIKSDCAYCHSSAEDETEWKDKNQKTHSSFFDGCPLCFNGFETDDVVIDLKQIKRMLDYVKYLDCSEKLLETYF
jgi:hypothetical protein